MDGETAMTLTTILAVIFAFGVLVIVHEFGHFWVARRCGVFVEKFSIGFGPKLFGFMWKETQFIVSLLPLGGYVKMRGEEDSETVTPNDPTSFSNQPLKKKAAIVLAGPIMNLILSFVLMPMVFMIGHAEAPSLNTPPVIREVMVGSPAERAGLVAGDTILKVNEKEIKNWGELIQSVQLGGNAPSKIFVERQKNFFEFLLQPEWNEENHSYLVGIRGDALPTDQTVEIKKYPFWESVVMGAKTNIENIALTFLVLKRLVTLQMTYKTLGGPVQIIYTLAGAAASGISDFIFFISFLSLQLAIMNLLPIPVLDGGHLFFYIIEGIRRKPLSLKSKMIAQQIGMALLLSLVLLVTWNDLKRLFF
ncbi:MAG: RIP metalloprotease RseP [Deltaproteobacteria bacterium]|nr:RIP metalloprotease RseP [Deltaproteobacteria bacterium]